MVFIKLDMDYVILLHLVYRMRGDQLGMEALGNVGQVLEDTLHVYDHSITGTGKKRQVLLQKGTGRWNAMTLQDLVGGAADATQLYALGTFFLRIGQHFLGLGCSNDHL